jgi:hypothetical protein
MTLEQDFEELAIQLKELNRRLENLEAADTGRTFTGDVTTTDATVTDIFTFSTATDTAYKIEFDIVGIRTDVAGDTGVYKRAFRVKNIGGTVTAARLQQNTTSDNFDWIREDNAAWDRSAVVSGTDFVVRVTGIAAQTIKWTMVATVLQLS